MTDLRVLRMREPDVPRLPDGPGDVHGACTPMPSGVPTLRTSPSSVKLDHHAARARHRAGASQRELVSRAGVRRTDTALLEQDVESLTVDVFLWSAEWWEPLPRRWPVCC